MKVLVVSILNNSQVNPNIKNLLGAAQQFDAPVDVLLIGSGNVEIAKLNGLNEVKQIEIDDKLLLATNLAPIIAQQAKNYTHILMIADSNGKDILPRVAGIMDVAQISEVIKICSPNIFKRPIYAGNIIAEVESFEDVKLLTIRPTSFAEVELSSNETIKPTKLTENIQMNSKITKLATKMSEGAEGTQNSGGLTLAKKIVSGGKSLGSKEDFDKLIRGLAKKMDASVGASRDAVEAGFISNDSQVGQTGKVVAPDLYVAVGISGAVQHIAGMKDSKTVLAINIDPTAQIFEYADYGFEGDLFEVVPQLIEKL